jgi:glutamate racemase
MRILSKDAPIGFFDSGVGGLTVLKQVKNILPSESFIFFGDTLHVPYGEKSKDELLSYSKDILKFFENKKVKAVVMACNTTSSVIYEDVKDKYDFKLYPLVQSCAKVFSGLNVNTLGVFATKATINSKAYDREIAKYNSKIKVVGHHCNEWVKIVENGTIHESENIKIVKNDLDELLKYNPDKIILGCTHYPYLLEVLSKFLPSDNFIDPAKIFADFIKNDLSENNLLSKSNERFEEFYVSSNPQGFKNSAKMFYDLPSEPQLLLPV